ncbi:MAG: ABC transporter ATP-binding protein [Planctomycetota bacterium]|nr:ABC transporter ATP-binding protein [Planctomycetota bacterium]
MPPALETQGLTKKFGRHIAVSKLSVRMEPGEIFGFLGPNGAGKTTTIRMLTGLVRPTSGVARIHGREIGRDSPGTLEGVGALIESPALYPFLDGADNLSVLSRRFGKAARRSIHDILERVGLADVAAKKVKAYSQGMRQRLGLALALLLGDRVLILDEPASGLDPHGRDELRQILRERSRDDGVAVFLSSHLLGEVEAICDRIGLLQAGRMVAEGKVSELLRPHTWRVRIPGDRVREGHRIALNTPWCRSSAVIDGCLEVELARDRASDLLRILVKEGLPVEEFAPVRPSLEDFFREHSSGGSRE